MNACVLALLLSAAGDELEEARTQLASLREQIERQKSALQRFAAGNCIGASHSHDDCPTPDECLQACEDEMRRMGAALKDLRARRAAILREWRNRRAALELELAHLHDRIEIYFDVRNSIQKIGQGHEREKEAWRRACIQAFFDAGNHLKAALRDRFRILSKNLPKKLSKKLSKESGAKVEAVSRVFDKVQEAWERYCKAEDAAQSDLRLKELIECTQAAGQSLTETAGVMEPKVNEELRLIQRSLNALVYGTGAFRTWQEHGWAKAAPELFKAIDNLQQAMAEASRYYKPLAVWSLGLGVGLTAEELAVDAAGAVLAYRSFAAFGAALELNRQQQGDVTARMAELGCEYERKDAERKEIVELLQD